VENRAAKNGGTARDDQLAAGPLDQLDPVAVRIGDEREARAVARGRGTLPIGLDPLLRGARERGMKVVDRERDVPASPA